MKIENKYMRNVFEALSKLQEDGFNQPLHNLTMINIEENKLHFRHLTREINTEVILDEVNVTNLKKNEKTTSIIDTSRITKLLREIPSEEIITYEDKGVNVELKSSKGKYKTATNQEIEEFNNLFNIPEQKEILGIVRVDKFIKLINGVKNVCVDNKPNTLVSLINFIFNDTELLVYATDGYRVAKNSIPLLELTADNDDDYVEIDESQVVTNISMVGKLVRKYVDFLSDLKKFTDDDVLHIYKKGNKIIFESESSKASILVSSLVFHDLSKHFQVKKNTVFEVNPKELRLSINRLNAFVRSATDLLTINYGPDKLELNSLDSRFDTSGTEELEIQNFEGDQGMMNFTSSLLKNSLTKYSENITITIAFPDKPILLSSKFVPLQFVILPIISTNQYG